MQWPDALSAFREELVLVRAERQRQAAAVDAQLQQARQELSRLADSLGISELLADINNKLLGGQGDIETIVSWDSSQVPTEEDELETLDDEDEDQDDAITQVLSWEEFGDREIAVELVLVEEGASVQVNGVEIRPERGALEQALLEAFRDELEL
jgi:hypothetical protein